MNDQQISLDEFAETVMDSTRQVGAGFTEADDDWLSVMEIQSGDGEMFIVGFDGAFMRNDMTKDVLVDRLMRPIINGCGGKRLALVMSAWAVNYKHDPRNEQGEIQGPSPSEHPERIEALTVTVMDAHEVRGYMAQIHRDGQNPPTLGDYESYGAGTVTGRFVEPVQEALRDSSGKPDPVFMERLAEIFGREA